MTEKEAKEMLAIHYKFLRESWKPYPDIKVLEAIGIAISSIDKLQQYRVIGTVEKFHQLAEQFKPHMIDETSCPKRCCNKCDKYRKENEKYHEIGTVKECQEAMEKQSAKKVSNKELLKDFNGNLYSVRGDCPNCGNTGLLSINTDYCNVCGQKQNWN